jgi:long-subunit acyl-CoA synthetase (AMP-forming)
MRPGDRIGIFLNNSVAWDIVQFGVLWAGGILVGLDRFSPPAVIADILRRSKCSGVFVEGVEDLKGWDTDTVWGLSWVLTRVHSPPRSSRFKRVMA